LYDIIEKRLKQNAENETTAPGQSADITEPQSLKDIPATETAATKAVVQQPLRSKYSATQLLEKAEDCMDSFDLELASKFCQRAVDLESDNVPALEMLGFLRLQAECLDSARKVSF